MAFNLKSLGDVANAISSAKDIVTSSSNLVSTVKGTVCSSDDAKQSTANEVEEMYPERIEKLIRLALAEGELDADTIQMLERAATREGLDPDEVVFVAKKRLKSICKAQGPALTPAKKLAYDLSEIDKKIDSAIDAVMMGNSSSLSGILDTITGGASGLVVSIGKSIFGESDDEKIEKLELARYNQRTRLISSTTTPDNYQHLLELLEYVFQQTKESDENAWDTLHLTVYNRAVTMAGNDEEKIQYIALFMPESLKPKKKKRFGLF